MRGRARLLLAAVACALAAGADAAADFGTHALMQTLAGVERASARFIETRHSPLLTSPIVLRGTLSYQRPDRMEKHVLSPYDERILIEGEQLTIHNRTRDWKKTLSITAAPGLAGLVESIRATRAGELRTLERFYKVETGGSRGRWWMRLRPHDPEIAEYLRAVTVRGSGPRIEQIEVDETSGDHTAMDIAEEVR